MKHLLPTCILFIMLTTACHTQPTDTTGSSGIPDTAAAQMKIRKDAIIADMAKAQIQYFIINVPGDQFGYYIMIDGKMYIEQKTIPSLSGQNGFSTKADAEKVAQFVVAKIKEGEMPPTVTEEDLKKMGINN